MARKLPRNSDCMSVAWLKRNPRPGFWAMTGLALQAQETVERSYRFPDGSVLVVVEHNGDKDFEAYGPSG